MNVPYSISETCPARRLTVSFRFRPGAQSCHRSAIVCHQTRDQTPCHMHSVQCSSPRCTLPASSWDLLLTFCLFTPGSFYRFLLLLIHVVVSVLDDFLLSMYRPCFICVTEITSCKFIVTCDISPNKWRRLYYCFSFFCTSVLIWIKLVLCKSYYSYDFFYFIFSLFI